MEFGSGSLSKSRSHRVIASVQRAIDILNLFNLQHLELSNAEISRAMNLPKSTVAGLVQTLQVNHLLEQNPVTRKFRLGYKLVQYSSILLNTLDVRQMAQPFLKSLWDWCNESVNLAVLDEGDVVYVERLFGTNLLGMHSEVGKREPVHSTALGKAMLSTLSEAEQREFLTQIRLSPKTPSTLTSLEAIIEDLRTTTKRGFAIDDEENELGGRCVAAPILDMHGRPAGAVSVSVPVQRLPRENIAELGEKVRGVADAISLRLGYPSGTIRPGKFFPEEVRKNQIDSSSPLIG